MVQGAFETNIMEDNHGHLQSLLGAHTRARFIVEGIMKVPQVAHVPKRYVPLLWPQGPNIPSRHDSGKPVSKLPNASPGLVFMSDPLAELQIQH